jgi:serine/arginine repetitive matrix protein 2
MAAKMHSTPSSSRVRFGFGHRHSRPRVPPEPPERADDGDWYIPYNGPFELPPAAQRSQNRDSWGQLLGSVLGNLGTAKSSEVGHEWSDGRMASGQHVTSALPSSGEYRSHPYRMNASPDAASTPGSASTGSQARGTSSQPLRGGRPTLTTTSTTTFANIDNTGGVGESPTPVQRSSPLHASPPSSATNRLSLGSFLTFGGTTRKSRSDSVHAGRQPSSKRPRNVTLPSDPLQSNRAMMLDPQASHSHSPFPVAQTSKHKTRQRSHTLMDPSAQPSSPSHDSSTNPFYTRESPLSAHPYANAFISSLAEAPRRTPIVPPSAPRSSDKGKGVDRSYQYPRPSAPNTLINTEVPAHLKPASRTSLFKTISAPNLRNLSSVNKSTSSRGKSRWLSPETWCDALLFPRPRFMEYIDDEPPQSFSIRQATPARLPEAHTERPKPPQTALRVSHSAVNLHSPTSEVSRGPPRAEPTLMTRGQSSNVDGLSSPTRPRSFAQDDLALPSPVPSLARSVA